MAMASKKGQSVRARGSAGNCNGGTPTVADGPLDKLANKRVCELHADANGGLALFLKDSRLGFRSTYCFRSRSIALKGHLVFYVF